jgi:hypothetical protein
VIVKLQLTMMKLIRSRTDPLPSSLRLLLGEVAKLVAAHHRAEPGVGTQYHHPHCCYHQVFVQVAPTVLPQPLHSLASEEITTHQQKRKVISEDKHMTDFKFPLIHELYVRLQLRQIHSGTCILHQL